VFVANVTTVKISARAQKSESTNEGEQKPQEASSSIAYSLLNPQGGN
jgi:16S rRNA C967 or C1407 C5-methylase (RsmB/RsmF family)